MSKGFPRQVGVAKTSKNPVKIRPVNILKKPSWIKVKIANNENFRQVKSILRKKKLNTVCEEASCPNIGECFGGGTATFMILGDLCTRRCPFCDVAHGRPAPPKLEEPNNLANAVLDLKLKYVVVTSVDRDDLKDGGAEHFTKCVNAIRKTSPKTRIEILTPDFRGRLDLALQKLQNGLPDIMNHNLETVSRLYPEARPGADYKHSLKLLKQFKEIFPTVITKSGIMVGMGETDEEIKQAMIDLRSSGVNMLTIGQYLRPTNGHLPVQRYVRPETFALYKENATRLGFKHTESGPLVRSSYHADLQAANGN